jgi:hypothetical protein
MTTLEVALIVSLISLLGGFFIKKAFEPKKALNINEKKVMMCPLDRQGTIDTINTIESKIDRIQGDLTIGVKVAERNTQHYEKFNDLLVAMNQNWKTIVSTLKEIKDLSQKQNDQLIKIAKNGH